MAEQDLNKLLSAVSGTSAKIIDEDGRLLMQGVLKYSGYEKKLSLGDLEIPVSKIRDVCPNCEGFKTLIFVEQNYVEAHA